MPHNLVPSRCLMNGNFSCGNSYSKIDFFFSYIGTAQNPVVYSISLG